MRVGSLFAGIGGFDLAARWMGWHTEWFSEIDPYASAVLKKHWPHVPNLGDITKITNPPPVDILVGGFPCQDISLAGNRSDREGISGERSGLWQHYARLIEESRPKYVVAENVSSLRSKGLGRVLGDLSALGYDAEWHCIPASAIGAPHGRDRLWIVAYTHGIGRSGHTERDIFSQAGIAAPLRDHTDRLGVAERGPWLRQSRPVGMADGLSRRVDAARLKCLGNAIVPHVAYTIFQAISSHSGA